MTKNITSIATAKGFAIIQTRKCIQVPFFGYIWLPLWLDSEPEFLSRKGCRYTLEGFIFKLQMKRDRRRAKQIIMENRRRMAIEFNQNL